MSLFNPFLSRLEELLTLAILGCWSRLHVRAPRCHSQLWPVKGQQSWHLPTSGNNVDTGFGPAESFLCLHCWHNADHVNRSSSSESIAWKQQVSTLLLYRQVFVVWNTKFTANQFKRHKSWKSLSSALWQHDCCQISQQMPWSRAIPKQQDGSYCLKGISQDKGSKSFTGKQLKHGLWTFNQMFLQK